MRYQIFRSGCFSVNLITLALLAALLMPRHAGDIFAKYDDLAVRKLTTMSLEEKISQILLVRYPDANGVEILEKYQFGGYIFFGKDFAGKTTAEVQAMMRNLQNIAKIPILTAVDEEGGSVVRVSSNAMLSETPFQSPQELYLGGGFSAIATDTKQKSALLEDLGVNLNLAPVVDVSTNPNDYMYRRSLGENTALTSQYARTVIQASLGTGVSYTLKHFPGYGNNLDTHKGGSVDQRTYLEILQNDLPPFRAGIDAGAEAVLVSHNTVTAVDSAHPASLSPAVHELLTDMLGFTGVIITDDIAMAALDSIPNVTEQAVLAGNDLIITTDYNRSIAEIKSALAEGRLSQEILDQKVKKVLAWKYHKNLLTE